MKIQELVMRRLIMSALMGLLFALARCLPLAAERPPSPYPLPLGGEGRVRGDLPAKVASEPLPAPDPIAFLEKCLEHYDQQGIRGYRLIFQKQERIGGILQPSEVIEVAFRADPFSVFMRWLRGARIIDKALFVEGENDGKVLVHPTGLAGLVVSYVARSPDDPAASQVGRYSIKDFGLKNTVERTLRDWKGAKLKGAVATYLGIRKVREAGGQVCYCLRQISPVPDAQGVSNATVYIDKKNWFQVGTILKDKRGRLLGDYYYRDIQLNPTFSPDQFQPSK
jgi:hypothetical protein